MLRHQTPDNGVTGLVVCRITLLFLAHDHGFALGAHHDLVFRELKLFHGNQTLVTTGRKQRSFVHQVRQVSTRETGRATGNQHRLHPIGQRHFLHVNLENLLTTDDVRQPDNDLAVKATRAEQRRIQYVRTVGGGNHDNAFVALEAVHLYQQLVQCLLTLVVTATHASATMAANGIDLVDEDDTGALLLGLLEHVTDTRGTHAHEHFHEVRTGDREEWHLGLAGNRLGEQGLTSTRLTHHQYALGDTATKTLELAGIPQEIHQLLDVFLGLVDTGNVTKGGFDLILAHQAGFTLAKGHRPFATATALHLSHEKYEQRDNDKDGEGSHQQLGPETLTLRLLTDDFHVVGQQIIHQLVVGHLGADGLELGAVTTGTLNLQTVNGDLTDLSVLHHFHKLRIIDLLSAGGGCEILKHHQQYGGYNQPENQIFCHIVQGSSPVN
eukprot:m.111489 g.111489  ORF g.111489 m.111489 type:complete len:439 (-) comp10753_c1_seq1:45-1361(-)